MISLPAKPLHAVTQLQCLISTHPVQLPNFLTSSIFSPVLMILQSPSYYSIQYDFNSSEKSPQVDQSGPVCSENPTGVWSTGQRPTTAVVLHLTHRDPVKYRDLLRMAFEHVRGWGIRVLMMMLWLFRYVCYVVVNGDTKTERRERERERERGRSRKKDQAANNNSRLLLARRKNSDYICE